MKTKKIKLAGIILFTMLSSFKLSSDIKGWFLAGSSPEKYEYGLERGNDETGNIAYLKSKQETKIKPGEFGTLMQSFLPKKYLGKKLKLTANIKTKNVERWCGMWMRIDGKKKHLAFDNMKNRKIKGSNNWKQYEIVLEVPNESINISYGVLISGKGEVWMDNFNFEIIK